MVGDPVAGVLAGRAPAMVNGMGDEVALLERWRAGDEDAGSTLLKLHLPTLSRFFRGKVDAIIMWFVSVVWSIPTLLLAIAITFAFEKGFWQVFMAIGQYGSSNQRRKRGGSNQVTHGVSPLRLVARG